MKKTNLQCKVVVPDAQALQLDASTTGGDCPWHLPFSTPVGCVSQCPDFMYINGTECVLTCGDQFVNGSSHCVRHCNESEYIISRVRANGCQLYMERKCVSNCGSDMFKEGRNCVDVCPANLTFIDVDERTCLSHCPSDKQLFTTKSYRGINLVECRKDCNVSSKNEFIFERSCVDTCPRSMVVVNRTCEFFCPEDRPFTQAENHNQLCVKNCSTDQLIFNFSCVSECPTDAEFLRGNVCSPDPCTGYFRKVSSHRTCVDKCEAYEFVERDECVGQCPEDHFVLNRTCVQQCTNEYSFVAKTDCLNHEYIRCYKVFISFNECLAECPNDRYRLNKTCVIFCPKPYLTFNKTCVEVCPQTAPILSNKPISRNIWYTLNGITYAQITQTVDICEENCPSDRYRLNNTCVKFCPKPYLTFNKTCVEVCPQTAPILSNKPISRNIWHTLNGYTNAKTTQTVDICEENCPSDRYRLNNTCVNFCPKPYLTFNKTCVDVCPQTAPMLVNKAITSPLGQKLIDGIPYSHKATTIDVCEEHCPANTVINGNTCSKSCPMISNYLHGQYCLSDPCPHYFYNISIHIKCVDKCDPYDFSFKNECMTRCPQDFVVFNGTCNDRCPDAFPLIANTTSTTTCSLGFRCERKFIKVFVECFDECNEGRYLLNGTCVPFCPPPYFTLNTTCVNECPGNTPFLLNKYINLEWDKWVDVYGYDQVYLHMRNKQIGVNTCETECPDSMFINGSTCLNDCPDNSGFLNGRHCVPECPRNKLFTEAQKCTDACSNPTPYMYNMTCVAECPGHAKFIFKNTCFKNCPPEAPYTKDFPYPDPDNTCFKECEDDNVDLNGVCVYKSDCNTSVMLLYERHCLAACPDGKLWTNTFNACFSRRTFIIASSITAFILFLSIVYGRISMWNFLQVIFFCFSEEYAKSVEKGLEETGNTDASFENTTNEVELQNPFDEMDGSDRIPLVRPNQGSPVELV